jgi:hypothetical protein
MDATILHPFQIQVPGILKSHGRNCKGVVAGHAQEIIQAQKLLTPGGAAIFAIRRGPPFSHQFN